MAQMPFSPSLTKSAGPPVSLITSRSLDRKPSSKVVSFPKRELMEVEEEKSRVVQEQKEVKKVPSYREENVMASKGDARIKGLESELYRARESESKMLESLTCQTKQLEEAKIELEEAKLEVRSLKETMKSNTETPRSVSSRNLEKGLDKSKSLDRGHTAEEILRLSNELKSAIAAEEKSKKAMDDLAIALNEVATENKKLKEKMSKKETEVLSAKAEATHMSSMLKSTEEKLLKALDETKRLKMEAEDTAAAWEAKKEGFVDCMKLFEDEITRTKKENSKLLEAQKSSRDEISKMRDIMKHALNEATVVKEALEIARNENSQLQDTVAENDSALKKAEQELQRLRGSEAAALQRVEELKALLAATTSSTETGNKNDGDSLFVRPKLRDIQTGNPNKAEEFSSERHHRKIQNPSLGSAKTDHPDLSGSRKSSSAFDTSDSSDKARRRFSSFSSVSVRGAPKAADPGLSLSSDDFDRLGIHSGVLLQHEYDSPTSKKKPAMLRKLGDAFRRSFRR